MNQCVLTLWLHTTYTSSNYVSTRVLGTQYKVGAFKKLHYVQFTCLHTFFLFKLSVDHLFKNK